MFRSCKARDPELFQKVKAGVSMQETVKHYGLETNRKGWCICPFHPDQRPSMKVYPDGKGYYCFACGSGGDPITFVARYEGVTNTEAAESLASVFKIPLCVPSSYREQREAEKLRRHRQEVAAFRKRARMYLAAYRGLLCEAIRERNGYFCEALQNISYMEYLLACIEDCPEEVYEDKRAVKKIGEIEGRIADWYIRIEADGTISRRDIL